MNKIKFITITLIFVMMALGMGYASWADQLTINNTVETGELSVKFAPGRLGNIDYPAAKASEYVDVKTEIDKEHNNEMKVTISNLYPGAWAAFRLRGINSGTIPVKISGVKVNFGGDTDLLPYFTYEAGMEIDSDGDKNIDAYTVSQGKLADIEKNFNENIKSNLKNIKIQPNTNAGFYFSMPEDKAPDLDLDGQKDRYIIIKFNDAPSTTQGKTLTFTFTVNFEQFNSQE